MIQNPVVLALTLGGIVLGLRRLETVPGPDRLFHYLPTAFWCYFTPVLLSTFNILPTASPVYSFLTGPVLAACLLLLLLNINLPAIFRLGPTALASMFVGALGIGIGAIIAWALWGGMLPPQTWKGIGALSASWIGGNANMVAVKEALNTPDTVFAPMVIVDTVITYSWMAFLVSLAPWQDTWDRWVKADRSALNEVSQRMETVGAGTAGAQPASAWHGLWLLGGALLIGWGCLWVGGILPPLGSALNAAGWSFMIVTLLGVLLSLTPAARLERYGASHWGYLCLYLLLAAHWRESATARYPARAADSRDGLHLGWHSRTDPRAVRLVAQGAALFSRHLQPGQHRRHRLDAARRRSVPAAPGAARSIARHRRQRHRHLRRPRHRRRLSLGLSLNALGINSRAVTFRPQETSNFIRT